MDQWYKELPPVTRVYLTLCLSTTVACALELITPFNIYFNPNLILQKYELWRLATNFLYFGNIGLDFLFHMFFLAKYCKALEEGSFRGHSSEFLWMLLIGAGMLNCAAAFVDVRFLGHSLTFMMVYVWARREPYVHMSFLGMFTFTAPYLPWVLLGFSVILRSSPIVDLLGIGAGHMYYFLEDVYPEMSGRRILKTPGLLRALFHDVDPSLDAREEPTAEEPGPEEQHRAVERGFPAPGVVPPPPGLNQGEYR